LTKDKNVVITNLENIFLQCILGCPKPLLKPDNTDQSDLT